MLLKDFGENSVRAWGLGLSTGILLEVGAVVI